MNSNSSEGVQGLDNTGRYLSLIKKSLCNELYVELEAVLHYLLLCDMRGEKADGAVIRDMPSRRPDIVEHVLAARADGSMVLWPNPQGGVYDPRNLSEHAHTMIGRKRLDSLHACLDTVLQEDVEGDLIETGVWRGGATVFMRAYLAAHHVTNRRVWVADSFRGLPMPSVVQDKGYDLSATREPILAVSQERVRALFARYDLLDEQVGFLPGWFRDTLPAAPVERLAILRLDGDLYESTMDALLALYDKVSEGGFIIVDDYGALPPCRKAVDDFRAQRDIRDPLETIDWTGAFWRKGGSKPARTNHDGLFTGLDHLVSDLSAQAASESASSARSFTVVPKSLPALEDCYFYHTMDLPFGTRKGDWDLRKGVDTYLGGVSFAEKSVLEIGPANGFLSFHMEKNSATVTALEPPLDHLWDLAPHDDFPLQEWRKVFLANIMGVRNAFWYAHDLANSKVRVIEARAESIGEDLGSFDIGLLASVLLHTRSPVAILESVARRVRETIIVTELYAEGDDEAALMRFIPRPDIRQVDIWWSFTPGFFIQALATMGFGDTTVTVHHQLRGDGVEVPFFTVVAHRTGKGSQP